MSTVENEYEQIVAELKALSPEELFGRCLQLTAQVNANKGVQAVFYKHYGEALAMYVKAKGIQLEELLDKPAMDLVIGWLIERAKETE